LANQIPDEPKPGHQEADSPHDGSLDLAKYLTQYNIPFQEKKEPTRRIFQLTQCLWAKNHTTGDDKSHAAIIQGNDGKLTYHCFHDHCKNRTWADARKAISGDDSLSQFWKRKHQTTFNKGIPERNLNEELKLWIEMAHGNFTTSQVYSDFDIKASGEKNVIRVGLHRMVEKGIIERGASNGTFRKVDHEANIIVIEDTISKPLPLKWPGELEKYVKIMPKSTVGVAGTMQAGKTAYLLNCAWMNKSVMPTFYFSSEFGADELRERLEYFGYPISQWRQMTFIDKSRDFQHVIKPDGLNLIDYLEVTDEGEFYKMGIQIKRIYEKLCTGVAVIGPLPSKY